jgi:WD40 repeat protein
VFRQKAVFTVHDAPIYCISTYKNVVFTGAADKTVKAFDLTEEVLLPFTIKSDATPISLCSLNENWLAIGYLNGEFYTIDISSKSTMFSHNFNTGVFTIVVIDKFRIALGLASGYLAIVDIESNELLYFDAVASDKIRSIAVSPTSEHLYIASKSGAIVIFNALNFEIVSSWQAHDLGVNCVLVTAQGQLISGGKDGYLKRWELNGALLQQIPAHRGVIYNLLAMNKKLISVSRDKSCKVWDLTTLNPIQKITVHRQSVNNLAQQNGHSFVTASDDHQIAWFEDEN